ncbi:Uncharacterized protein APZ42_020769 [Daphnia magna]|uniref:Uncharacterized protein n=1 Tax=Daphnia magna TaxID=35525 RepID=A0A164XDS7_9CRUS|nr:Uncharacterized protein APZ42_020769 [Daphnia magna]
MLLPNKPCSKIDPAALAPIVGCCVSLLLVHLVYVVDVHILPTSTAQSAPEFKKNLSRKTCLH